VVVLTPFTRTVRPARMKVGGAFLTSVLRFDAFDFSRCWAGVTFGGEGLIVATILGGFNIGIASVDLIMVSRFCLRKDSLVVVVAIIVIVFGGGGGIVRDPNRGE